MKHFNTGNVWGRVSQTKEEYSTNGTPYLAITVECPNELFGNLRTYGRLWGQEKIKAFLHYHENRPGSAYRFTGFFNQYENKGERYSNYTFFNWQAVDCKEFRAAFVLVGEVTKKGIEEQDDKFSMLVIREGQSGYNDIEELFEIFTLDTQDIANIKVGDIVQIKGVMRYKDAEDYFGGTPEGKIKPYAMDIKIRQPEPAPTENEPF